MLVVRPLMLFSGQALPQKETFVRAGLGVGGDGGGAVCGSARVIVEERRARRSLEVFFECILGVLEIGGALW